MVCLAQAATELSPVAKSRVQRLDLVELTWAVATAVKGKKAGGVQKNVPIGRNAGPLQRRCGESLGF